MRDQHTASTSSNEPQARVATADESESGDAADVLGRAGMGGEDDGLW